jgi:hypothetical protein
VSRAGQGDAVGGVFRVVAATFLAVHSLRGQPTAGLEPSGAARAVRLDFETDDATDDLVATMSDARRCFVSAKRAVGNDRHLKDTVLGWVGQMAGLGDEDLLVIAAEDLTGVVRDLDEALRRRRDGRQLAERHRKAIAAVTQHVPPGLAETLLDRVRVLHIPSSTGTSLTRTLLESMAGYLVQDGDGAAVVSALSDSFAALAGDASASTEHDWVRAIGRGSRRVIADGTGPPGMRLAAELAAREAYVRALTAPRGRIDLTLLADDLPPVTADGLVDGLRVDLGQSKTDLGYGLVRAARRWRRMLLVGQPGAGKSVALRELAADCADDPHAPFPVHVRLPELMRDSIEDVTVDALLAAAGRLSDPSLRAALARQMRQELDGGTALLLCDGLDECGVRAAWMAQQLKDVVDRLHPRAGLVVATRANAVPAADRLGLPRANLQTPNDLADTVDSVLEACARARADGPGSADWLAARRRWIADARQQHPELLKVPLLAVLLALVCADTPEADLPKSRALVLHAAVEQSVNRWEIRRTADPARPWARELTPKMLLDGYVTLGRRLDAGPSPTRAEALAALAGDLASPDRWALAPSAASEIAADVLRFWDEHVAVFVVDASNHLTSRSKVFAEIATAMWTLDATDDDLRAWLADALPWTDSDGAIALAGGLNSRLVELMLDPSESTARIAGPLLADLAVRGIVALDDDQTGRLLQRLEDAAGRAASGEDDHVRGPREPGRLDRILRRRRGTASPGWKHAELACSLPLTAAHRPARDAVLAAAALPPSEAETARAVCALTDADADGAPLDAVGLSAVEAVLARPLPPDGELVRESRRRSVFVGGSPIGPGVARVALLAAKHLDALPPDTARWAFDVSMKAPHGSSDKIRAALDGAGADTRRWWAERSPFRHAKWWKDEHDQYETELLRDITALQADAPGQAGRPPRDDLWSLTASADLLDATGYGTVSVNDFALAFLRDTPAMRRGWLDALADAHRIDKDLAARQAASIVQRRTADSGSDTGRDADWAVMTTPGPNGREPAPLGAADLTSRQHAALVDALEAASDWLAWSAANVLINVPDPTWDVAALFDKDLSRQSVNRAALVRAVAIVSAGDQRIALFARAAASPAAEYRAAAQYCLSIRDDLDADGTVAARLAVDPDLTVRDEADRKREPAASHWTCLDCRRENDIDMEDCPGCDDGSRPG